MHDKQKIIISKLPAYFFEKFIEATKDVEILTNTYKANSNSNVSQKVAVPKWIVAEELLFLAFKNTSPIAINQDLAKCIAENHRADLSGILTALKKFHSAEVSLQTIFGDNSTPSLHNLRSTLYEVIIELLNSHYPERTKTHIPLPNLKALKGMEKIREMVAYYIKHSHSFSIERFKLAHDLAQEKFELNLPSFIHPDKNIFVTNYGYCPGDLGNLDLSYLNLSVCAGDGKLKGLSLKNCNLVCSDLQGICLSEGMNFSDSDLRGVNFDAKDGKFSLDSLVLNNANIEGTFFETHHVPDRRTRNHHRISNSLAELHEYRKTFLLQHKDVSVRAQIMFDHDYGLIVPTQFQM